MMILLMLRGCIVWLPQASIECKQKTLEHDGIALIFQQHEEMKEKILHQYAIVMRMPSAKAQRKAVFQLIRPAF